MKISDIQIHTLYAEIKPTNKAGQLRIIETLSIEQHFETNFKNGKQRNYSYRFAGCCQCGRRSTNVE